MYAAAERVSPRRLEAYAQKVFEAQNRAALPHHRLKILVTKPAAKRLRRTSWTMFVNVFRDELGRKP